MNPTFALIIRAVFHLFQHADTLNTRRNLFAETKSVFSNLFVALCLLCVLLCLLTANLVIQCQDMSLASKTVVLSCLGSAITLHLFALIGHWVISVPPYKAVTKTP